MKKIEYIENPYGSIIKDGVRYTKKVYTINDEPSMTDQDSHDDADINSIVAKFQKTGHITNLAKGQMDYHDMSGITDLLTMHQIVREADDAFMALPSWLRAKMENSPQKFIQWLNDPKNFDEAVKLGLLETDPKYSSDRKQAEGALETQNQKSAKQIKQESQKTNDKTNKNSDD